MGKKIRNFFIEMLSSDGKVSSKRLITFGSFLLLTVGFIANLFWDFKIDEFIYEAIEWIVMFGLGATASEQFANRTKGIKRDMTKDSTIDEGQNAQV